MLLGTLLNPFRACFILVIKHAYHSSYPLCLHTWLQHLHQKSLESTPINIIVKFCKKERTYNEEDFGTSNSVCEICAAPTAQTQPLPNSSLVPKFLVRLGGGTTGILLWGGQVTVLIHYYKYIYIYIFMLKLSSSVRDEFKILS